MNYMKMHKYSAAIMMIGAIVCMYSGHKMISRSKK